MALNRSWLQKRSRWNRQTREHDPLEISGVLSSTQLEDLLCRERARVERNGQCFSLVVFRIETQRAGDLRHATEVLASRARAYDTVGMVEDQRVATLLPETDGDGAWIFADAVLAHLAALDLRASCDVYSYPHAHTAGVETTGRDRVGHDYGFVPRPDDAELGSGALPKNDRDVASASSTGGAQVIGIAEATSTKSEPTEHPEGSPSGVEHVTASLRTGTDGLPVQMPIQMAMNRVGKPVRLRALGALEVHRQLPNSLQSPQGRTVQDLSPLFVEPLPFWRRAIDIAASGAAILALSPVLLTTAFLVKATSPGPIIFSQLRVGRGGRQFRFFKFRSMYRDAEERKNALRIVNEKDGPIFKIKNDPRITPLGRVIRRLSIDELPQLFNVFKGDMTLVGPRPPVVDEVEQYEPWQRQRLDITGGLTCIWQVSGRSEVSFDDWMRMDIRYKQKRTIKLDAKLLWKTVGAVFSGRGAY